MKKQGWRCLVDGRVFVGEREREEVGWATEVGCCHSERAGALRSVGRSLGILGSSPASQSNRKLRDKSLNPSGFIHGRGAWCV